MADVLLDTCALLWASEDQGVSAEAEASIADASENGRVLVSPISAWEIGLLCAKARLQMALEPKRWFEEAMRRGALSEAPLSPRILIDASFLPGEIHGDPADRILVATARWLGVALVTRDRRILDYGALGHVKTVPC